MVSNTINRNHSRLTNPLNFSTIDFMTVISFILRYILKASLRLETRFLGYFRWLIYFHFRKLSILKIYVQIWE
jgi:hypothetical protein